MSVSIAKRLGLVEDQLAFLMNTIKFTVGISHPLDPAPKTVQMTGAELYRAINLSGVNYVPAPPVSTPAASADANADSATSSGSAGAAGDTAGPAAGGADGSGGTNLSGGDAGAGDRTSPYDTSDPASQLILPFAR